MTRFAMAELGRLRWHVLAAFVALGLLVGLACESKGTTATQGTAEGPVLDTEILAFLSLARAGHHQADILEGTGDVDGALASLERIVHAPRPHPGQTIPEVEETLADAYARMADLRLTKGDVAGAKKDVDDGLTHAAEPTYFRGHLFTMYGIVEQRRAADAADAGHDAEAAEARSHAVTLLREAMDIQERVIGKVLGDAGADR